MKIISAITVFSITLVVGTIAFGQRARPASSQAEVRRQNVEKIVRDYLLKNPEIVREAMQTLQDKEEKAKRESIAVNIKNLRTEIYSDVDSPIAGNPKGDVSVVVFFDYFCGYCKKTLPALQTLLANDGAVRVVYKEFPILGPQSLVAAKAALAAGRQGKFTEFHQAMLAAEGASEEVLKAVSENLGLDYAKLQKEMLDPKIAEAIDRNIQLAESLNVSGTPAYLIGDQFIPGAIDSDSLAKVIKQERSKLTKAEPERAGAAGLR